MPLASKYKASSVVFKTDVEFDLYPWLTPYWSILNASFGRLPGMCSQIIVQSQDYVAESHNRSQYKGSLPEPEDAVFVIPDLDLSEPLIIVERPRKKQNKPTWSTVLAVDFKRSVLYSTIPLNLEICTIF